MESSTFTATGLPAQHVPQTTSLPISTSQNSAAPNSTTTNTQASTAIAAAADTLQPPVLPLQQATMSAVADARRHETTDAAPAKKSAGHDYKGFVAGVGSGIAKLSGMQLYCSKPINESELC